jgi:hypothetical protein
MIHGCLSTVSHKFSMYSIQKLGNKLLFLENKKLLGLTTWKKIMRTLISLKRCFRFLPTSTLESLEVAVIRLVSSVLLSPFDMCHIGLHIPRHLVSYRTTNIGSLNSCTSWYCQGRRSRQSHDLL